MGRFLIIGLKLEACVYKDRINKYVNERRTEADILTELEEALRLGKEYDRKEKKDYYTYSLKQEICDKELLPFLKHFYDLRYTGENRESDFVLEKLSALSPQERLKLLEQKQFECFQEDEKTHYCYLDNCGWFEIPVYTRKIVLSMDGKMKSMFHYIIPHPDSTRLLQRTFLTTIVHVKYLNREQYGRI